MLQSHEDKVLFTVQLALYNISQPACLAINFPAAPCKDAAFFLSKPYFCRTVYRVNYILVAIIAVLIFCCKKEKAHSLEAELVKYPKPFYDMKPGSSNSFYYGIKNQRFFYVEDMNGPWILYDRYVGSGKPINVAGLDEYTFIELDLARQLHESLQKNTNDFLFETPNFYDLYVRNKWEKTKKDKN